MSTSSGRSSPLSPYTHCLAQAGINSYSTRRQSQTITRSCLPRPGVGRRYSLPRGQHVCCSTMFLQQGAARATASSNNCARIKSQQPLYRWFAFDTETTGLSLRDDCVIQLAAYDVESGNAYTTLVNPAYHKPEYKFGQEAAKKHGIQQSLVESEGIPLQQAMADLVEFVNTTTPVGHTPALVAHYGYKFHFPILHNNLQAAAAAATAPAGNLLSRTNSTAGRRRRRKIVKRSVHSWPSKWMFHDTYLMARSIDKIDRMVPGMRPLSTKLTRESLVQSLLPPTHSEADVKPHERAFAEAASVAKLLPLLSTMINNPPELHGPGSGDTRGGTRHQDPFALSHRSLMLEQRSLLYQLHRCWLSRPWPLNYSRLKTSEGVWVPRGAVEAMRQQQRHEDYINIKHDPVEALVRGYWSFVF